MVAHQTPLSMEFSRVAIPFSRGSFWPRDWAWVFCIAGRFFTIWATRGALYHNSSVFLVMDIRMSPACESEVTQLCQTLCDSMHCSLPSSSIRGIFQARVVEWSAISFSRVSYQPRDWTSSQADSLLTEQLRKLQLIAMNKHCCCRHSCAFHLVYIRLTLELYMFLFL